MDKAFASTRSFKSGKANEVDLHKENYKTRLPYSPSPYPDEILGSWLARVAMYNGKGAWNALLEEVCYPRIASTLFDLPDYKKKLEKLLEALGYSYERALLELTTLPYWLAFDSDIRSGRILYGTNNIPLVLSPTGSARKSFRKIGTNERYTGLRKYKYCPKCLDEDVLQHGEPYWHRAHQLPNVFFCHLHACLLQTTCRKCNRKIVAAQTLIELPTRTCSCGHMLNQAINGEKADALYIFLARISTQALQNGIAAWDRAQVHAGIKKLLTVRGRYNEKLYQAAISNGFNLSMVVSNDVFRSVLPNHHNQHLVLHPSLRLAIAPDVCALLAALNIDFTEAVRYFGAEKLGEKLPNNSASLWPKILTVEFAREEMLLRVGKENDKKKPKPSEFPRLYWYLRIYDNAWFSATFYAKNRRPLPTKAQDRKEIKKILKSLRWTMRRVKAIDQCGAFGIRANLRDREWFVENLNNRFVMPSQTNRGNEEMLLEKTNLLKDAIESVSNMKGRPFRLTKTRLAKLTGLTHAQISMIYQKRSSIKFLIQALEKSREERTLIWAAKMLKKEKKPLSPTSIYKRSGLARDYYDSKLIRKCMELVNKTPQWGPKLQ